MREQVQRLGLHNVTLDLRFVSPEELVALYRAADIVTYPYRAITTSGALATGLALGKAVVASGFTRVPRAVNRWTELPCSFHPAMLRRLRRLLLRLMQ